jgi:hypothetical protein
LLCGCGIVLELSCIHRSSVIIPPIEAYVVGGFNNNVRINGDLNKDRLTNKSKKYFQRITNPAYLSFYFRGLGALTRGIVSVEIGTINNQGPVKLRYLMKWNVMTDETSFDSFIKNVEIPFVKN